ncbi:hypothetical protein P9228_18465 [Mesorhizobium sp. WSM4898]|uniref:hypothetical protein n=1 Tax=Mesorhizobium sp. WSM4898 TaxID=3038544 RepID=UPI0024150838|nr:hypothetical protein [Mesorhizobium sp. WSM4898]MDG4908413.1 hypothetical protein [Mesorhizobium sp. WSM4898]
MNKSPDLDDITLNLGHLAELLEVLVDITCHGPSMTPGQLNQVCSLSAIARDVAKRTVSELEECHSNLIVAGKRAA